jgi:uncharacterized membrane protein YkvI
MMENTQKKNSLKQARNIVGLTALLLGSQIGAGYASGREIVGFFGENGWFNIALFFVLFIGYFVLLHSYVKVARKVNAKNITDVTNVAFGKISFVANILLFIAMFAGLSATLAGLDSVANMSVQNYHFPWLSLIIGIVVIVVVSGGLKSVLKLANLAVPLLIVVLLVTTIYFFIFGTHGQMQMPTVTLGGMGVGFFTTLFYVGSNLNSGGTLLTQIHNKFDEKTLKWSSFLFALFFSLGVLIVISVLYLSTNTIFESDMPLAMLATSIHAALGVVYRATLFFAITMTLTAVSFTLTNWFEQYFKNRILTVIVIVGAGFLVSRLGFGAIIDYLYPIKGAGGLIVGVGVYIYYLKHKTKKP